MSKVTNNLKLPRKLTPHSSQPPTSGCGENPDSAGRAASREKLLRAARDVHQQLLPSGGNLSEKMNGDAENPRRIEVCLLQRGTAGSNLDGQPLEEVLQARRLCLSRGPSAHGASPSLSEALLQNSPGAAVPPNAELNPQLGEGPRAQAGAGRSCREALLAGKAARSPSSEIIGCN